MPGSNSIREIKTRLSVDGETAFRKSIKSVDSSLKAMKSELKLVRSGFDDTTDSMYKNEREAEVLRKMQEQLKVKVDALAGATDEAAKAYEDARKEAEKLTAEYGENSEKAKIAWQQVETLGTKMDRMATQSNNAERYLNDVTEQLKNVGTKADDAKEKSKDAAENGFTVLKGAAANLVSEGLSVMLDSLKDIVTELGNADSAYNNFAIKTGASAKDMEQYSDAIMALYKDNYGDSLSDVSDSMATVKQLAGDIPTDKLQEVTEYAIALDDAFGYDVAESMRTVNSLADQFGVSYSEAFNLIVQGAQKGLDQNGDMLDTFNEYSVQFKNLGYSADDMFNMLSNGVQSGTWSVDKLGDAVKEFNIRVTDGTADEALSALGLDLANIKTQFADGGVAAQLAQQEIINALMGVEDEQERYMLGQQLIGTMWEDLGETTVAALFNTNGEISSTKDAMQEVIDLKYDDLGSRIEAVGRKAKTEIAEPLIEKYMPKIEKGLEFVTENLDEIISTAEVVGKVIVTAFAVKKVWEFGNTVSSTVKAFIGTVKNLTTATQGQAAANVALNATNPWGWVALAVAGVGALTYAIVENYETYDEAVEKAAALTEEEQKLRDATHEVVEKYNDWKTAKDTAITGKDAEFKYYSELKTELDGIVDESGKIKENQEKRAEFITSELGRVTGIELEIVDGQIQKYNELSTAIENALKMKKAEAYLGASEEMYLGAIEQTDPMNEQGAYAVWKNNIDTLEQQKNELSNLYKTAENLKKQMNFALTIKDPSTSTTVYNEAKWQYDDTMAHIDGLSKKIAEQEQAIADSKKTYDEYVAIIQNYEKLSSDVIADDVENIDISLMKMKYNFRDATNATKEELIEQRNNFQTTYDQMLIDLKNNVPGITKESVKQMKTLIDLTDAEIAYAAPEFKATTMLTMQNIVAGMKSADPEIRKTASDLLNSFNDTMYYSTEKTYEAGRTIAGSLRQGVNDYFNEDLGSFSEAVSKGISVQSVVNSFKSQMNTLPHFATGTDNFKGGFAVINENSKGELVNLPDGSQVIPHDISLRYAEEAAAQGNTINNTFGNINISISAPNLNSQASARSAAIEISDKLVSEISRKLKQHENRYSSAIGR